MTIIQGSLRFYSLNEDGSVISEHLFDVTNQPSFIEPQAWHKVAPASDDLICQLRFYCQPEEYVSKKYQLTTTHSEVMKLYPLLSAPGKVLDLGCGQGRNTLFLNLKGFDVDAWDHNPNSIHNLQSFIEQDQLSGISTKIYDINSAQITNNYDAIISTVVMMFLDRARIPFIIENMQQHTNSGGHNLIVAAMSTKDVPCPMDFPFTFSEGELANYYKDWEIIEYKEELGALHKVDAQGNRIKMKFVTMIARKP